MVYSLRYRLGAFSVPLIGALHAGSIIAVERADNMTAHCGCMKGECSIHRPS